MTQNIKPDIYTLYCDSWIGPITKKSFMVEQPKCPKCKRDLQEEIEYSKVQLEIEKYAGQDMVSSQGSLFVTEKLYNALIHAGIKGFAPLKVSKVKYKYADIDMKTVPDLIYLAVLPPSVRNIPIAYDYTGICEGCNLYMGKYNREKFKLMLRENYENAIHLQVFYDSYSDSDIFKFADHGETGVTQKFLDVLKDFNCPEKVIIQDGYSKSSTNRI
jgi:hypothetical protein